MGIVGIVGIQDERAQKASPRRVAGKPHFPPQPLAKFLATLWSYPPPPPGPPTLPTLEVWRKCGMRKVRPLAFFSEKIGIPNVSIYKYMYVYP